MRFVRDVFHNKNFYEHIVNKKPQNDYFLRNICNASASSSLSFVSVLAYKIPQ